MCKAPIRCPVCPGRPLRWRKHSDPRMTLLGIDVGGSVIKAAPVDVSSGALAAPVVSVPTPMPATPAQIKSVVAGLAGRFPGVTGPIGLAFPTVVKAGLARTAANVDPAWIGHDGAQLVREATGRSAAFINDADAAGLAEMRHGAGRGEAGLVIVLTFGTGIGSAIFHAGQLLPNSEFGRMEIRGQEAESRASARARTASGLDWAEWAERVNEVLERMQALFWPDLFVIGGGVTENWSGFGPLLKSPVRIAPAKFGNAAGIVGAALAAAQL